MARRLALVAALLAVTSPAARAATVEGTPGSDFDPASVAVRDPEGKDDRLELQVAGTTVTVRSLGPDPLVAEGTCRPIELRSVRCFTETGAEEVVVDTGRGADRVTVDSRGDDAGPAVTGGPGRDRLTVRRGRALLEGGPGRDELTGGPDRDELSGGAGRDRVRGRGGADVLAGEGVRGQRAASDVLDGGPGRDRAEWKERPTPVRVDLATGTGETGGATDRLRSIEGAVGGRARDVLRGDGGPNVLLGSRGADRLAGLGGDDRLGAGVVPALDGGGSDRAPDRIGCGPGRDAVLDAGVLGGRLSDADPLPRDCETLVTLDRDVVLEPVALDLRELRGGRVRVGVVCVSLQACRLRVTLRHGRRVLARRTVRARRPFGTVVLRLRRPLPSRGVVAVTIAGTDEDGGPGFRFAYRLRR